MRDILKKLLSLIPSNLRHKLKYFFKEPRLLPILVKERYNISTTYLLGKPFKFADSASFVYLYDELFIQKIYNFNTNNNKPLIIDCGANIGLSIIFFKKLYPNCQIIAFEPDKKIFEILKENISVFGYDDVELIPKGLWKDETILSFFSDESDGGSLVNKEVKRFEPIKVKTDLLSKYLEREVDLLKIDIEGAELEVLKEAGKHLSNVRKIFVEYHSFIEKKQDLHEIIEILISSGFRIFINPVSMSSQPFKRINTYAGMDMQLNIFGIRQ